MRVAWFTAKICDAGGMVYGADWGDSNRLAYATPEGLHWVQVEEGSSPELLLATDKARGEMRLCHPRLLPGNQSPSIWIQDLRSRGEPWPIARTPGNSVAPAFSPDGQLLAYTADSTGRYQVYVRRVSDETLPVQVSVTGGSQPAWSRDGQRLYFRSQPKILMARLKSQTPLEFEKPTVFATGRFASVGINAGADYDVSSWTNGDRLLMLKSTYDDPEPHDSTHLAVLVHFDEYLRQEMAKHRTSAPK
jgi:hypothetical protein